MGKMTVPDGTKTYIQQTSKYDAVDLGSNSALVAPDGQHAVMTVKGHVQQMLPGSYSGNVVITTATPHVVHYKANGEDRDYEFISAVFVDDGEINEKKSVLAAVQGGTLTNQGADNVVIQADLDSFGGFYITGKTSFHIRNSSIRLNGIGGNDFIGLGAGITTNGNAHVIIDGCTIENTGLTRSALVALGHSRVDVLNSSIEVKDGNHDTPGGVPWMLGLKGKVRATNLLEYASVNYKNCHIKAQGWGCMSTDATEIVNLNMEDCLVETTDSGYGCYSIGYCQATFRNCRFFAADIGTVMAIEGSAAYTDGSRIHGGRFGIMMHHLGASGTLLLTENSEIYGGETAIQIKGRGAYIVVDHSSLRCGSGGLLIHSVNEDDPMAIGGPGLASILSPDGNMDEMALVPDDVKHSGDNSDSGIEFCLGDGPANHDIITHLRGTHLVGNILHTRVHKGTMTLHFEDSSIIGAISTGTSEHKGPLLLQIIRKALAAFQTLFASETRSMV